MVKVTAQREAAGEHLDAIERFAVAMERYFGGTRGQEVGKGEIDRPAVTAGLLDSLKASARPADLDALRAQLDALLDACEAELARFGRGFFGAQGVRPQLTAFWSAVGVALSRFDGWDSLDEASAEVAATERAMSEAQDALSGAVSGMDSAEAARLHGVIDFDLVPRLAEARANVLRVEVRRLVGEVDALDEAAASLRSIAPGAVTRATLADAKRQALERLYRARADQGTVIQAATDQVAATARALAASATEAQRVENFRAGHQASEGQA